MLLYHVKVGFPKWFRAPKNVITPFYGDSDTHVNIEARTDRYGHIDLPKTLDLSKFEPIEIGVEDGKIMKILFRGSLDATRDLCIVITNTGRVKTVWVNLKTDHHQTLNRSKYSMP